MLRVGFTDGENWEAPNQLKTETGAGTFVCCQDKKVAILQNQSHVFFSRYRQQIIPSKPKTASKSIALGLVRKQRAAITNEMCINI